MRNKKIRLFSVVLTSFILSLTMISTVFAAVTPQVPGTGETGGPRTIDQLIETFGIIIGYFQAIVLGIGIIMIIAAGLVWMTAAGNDEKLAKARKMLIWGLIGIAVALFAYVAQSFVTSLIGK